MLEYWYQALNAERGVVIRTEDRDAFRQKLYRARAEAADVQLEQLSIVFSPTDTEELWIIHAAKKT